MKKQEAINCIDDVMNSEYHFDESLGYQLTSDDFEWLEEAKKALEKQIPKRVKSYKTFGGCPVCGYVLNFELVNKYGIKHCPECGQALDFSERSNTDEN